MSQDRADEAAWFGTVVVARVYTFRSAWSEEKD